MRIAVTGGAGFIGSHVVDLYIKHNHQVFVIDDLSNGREENVNSKAEFFKEDIRNYEKIREIFKKVEPEVVNHHAAQIMITKSIENPSYDAEVNIIGTVNLLKLCVEFNVKKFIFASTGGAIYGNPDRIPADEDTFPSPLSPYGISKFSAERYVLFFEREFGIPSVILRYGNVYGPRQDPYGEAGVIAIFSKRILEKKPCIIYGNGNQTRDFVYVEDVAEVNLLALEKIKTGIYNVGTGKETSVNRIFEILKDIEPSAQKEYAPARKGEVYRISLCIDRLSKSTGWKPACSIEEGIRKTFRYFKENG